MHSILLWIAEWQQNHSRCSASRRSKGRPAVPGCFSSFGWKQGGLVDTLSYTCDSRNSAREPLEKSLHTPGTSTCLRNCLSKGDGGGSPSKSIDPVLTEGAGSKRIANHLMSLIKQISGRAHTRLFLCEAIPPEEEMVSMKCTRFLFPATR